MLEHASHEHPPLFSLGQATASLLITCLYRFLKGYITPQDMLIHSGARKLGSCGCEASSRVVSPTIRTSPSLRKLYPIIPT
jgi:hypothetical protein